MFAGKESGEVWRVLRYSASAVIQLSFAHQLLTLLDELGLLLLTAGILREKDCEGEEDNGQPWRREKRGFHGPDYLTKLGGGLSIEDTGTLGRRSVTCGRCRSQKQSGGQA